MLMSIRTSPPPRSGSRLLCGVALGILLDVTLVPAPNRSADSSYLRSSPPSAATTGGSPPTAANPNRPGTVAVPQAPDATLGLERSR